MVKILISILMVMSLQASEEMCLHSMKKSFKAVEMSKMAAREQNFKDWKSSTNEALFWNRKAISYCEGKEKLDLIKKIRVVLLERKATITKIEKEVRVKRLKQLRGE